LKTKIGVSPVMILVIMSIFALLIAACGSAETATPRPVSTSTPRSTAVPEPWVGPIVTPASAPQVTPRPAPTSRLRLTAAPAVEPTATKFVPTSEPPGAPGEAVTDCGNSKEPDSVPTTIETLDGMAHQVSYFITESPPPDLDCLVEQSPHKAWLEKLNWLVVRESGGGGATVFLGFDPDTHKIETSDLGIAEGQEAVSELFTYLMSLSPNDRFKELGNILDQILAAEAN